MSFAMMLRRTPATVLRKNLGCASSVRNVHIEKRLEELGITLPEVSPPKGNYVLVKRMGNTLFTAGHLPVPADGSGPILGKVGQDLSTDEGYEAARHVAINMIATLKHELGDLDKVDDLVKVFGLVNCVDGFSEQPQVINGFSDTMAEIFGEKGKHARSAVGTNALPLNVAVEIEAFWQVKD